MILLKNMDCFDFLSEMENDSVSLVLIDPPYTISKKSNFRTGAPTGRNVDRFRVSTDFGDWDKDFSGFDVVVNECYRILKKSGTIISFCDLWKLTINKELFESAGFRQLRFIEWLKTNPVPINSKINYLTNAREVAITGVKNGKPTFHSEYDNGIYHFPICHGSDRFHPTQKPLRLIEELVKKHSNEGDLVLDCFAGSGTTAIAAYNTNRNFVGCELSAEYYQNTLRRFADSGIKEQIGGNIF